MVHWRVGGGSQIASPIRVHKAGDKLWFGNEATNPELSLGVGNQYNWKELPFNSVYRYTLNVSYWKTIMKSSSNEN